MQDDYELEENDADLVDQGTPYHWRMRAHALGYGAFHGLKVISMAPEHFACFSPDSLPCMHPNSHHSHAV